MRIGNLQAMPWYLRLVIFVAVAGLMYAGFWNFVTKPTRAETKALNDEIAQLLPKNAQAQIASQRLSEFRALYKTREEEYEELKALLPEQRELTMVLQGVQDRAHANGLVLRKFFPKDDIQEGNYSGKKIEVSVTSTFNALRNFFDHLARYQRIVSVTNFQLNQVEKPTSRGTVDATFDLTAYYVSAEKLQQPAAKTAKPGKAPAAAPATAAAAPKPAK